MLIFIFTICIGLNVLSYIVISLTLTILLSIMCPPKQAILKLRVSFFLLANLIENLSIKPAKTPSYNATQEPQKPVSIKALTPSRVINKFTDGKKNRDSVMVIGNRGIN